MFKVLYGIYSFFLYMYNTFFTNLTIPKNYFEFYINKENCIKTCDGSFNGCSQVQLFILF